MSNDLFLTHKLHKFNIESIFGNMSIYDINSSDFIFSRSFKAIHSIVIYEILVIYTKATFIYFPTTWFRVKKIVFAVWQNSISRGNRVLKPNKYLFVANSVAKIYHVKDCLYVSVTFVKCLLLRITICPAIWTTKTLEFCRYNFYLYKGIVGILSDNLNVAFCSHSVQIIYARLDNSIPLTLQQFVATFV